MCVFGATSPFDPVDFGVEIVFKRPSADGVLKKHQTPDLNRLFTENTIRRTNRCHDGLHCLVYSNRCSIDDEVVVYRVGNIRIEIFSDKRPAIRLGPDDTPFGIHLGDIEAANDVFDPDLSGRYDA